MSEEKFWKKSWDEGISDLDPKLWEISYTEAIRPTFKELSNELALEFLGVKITFGELDNYSNQFSNMLISHGFKKGDVVGINLVNIPQYVIAWLGCLKIGCVVSGVSPLLSAQQIEYQINDGAIKGLVTLDAIFAGHIVKLAPKLPNLSLIIATNIADFLPKIKQVLAKALGKVPKGKISELEGKTVLNFMDILNGEYSAELPSVKITPDDLAYLQYTGGTTGPPKGAMLTHRNIVSDILIFQHWLSWEETRGKGTLLSGFPYFHIAGIFTCANCIYLGWKQLLLPDPRNSKHIIKLIKKFNPTAMANVPSFYQILLKNPKFKDLDHSKLETAVSAASPFPKQSQEEFESIVGKGKLIEYYGMTETAPLTFGNPTQGTKKLGTVGLPLPNTDVKLVDPESGNKVSLGNPGEICIKGPMVMKGYYKKPEETKKAIDADGFMHTGDVGIMDEQGYVRIVDRTKDMISVSGFKVFSTKVEDTLSKHPAIGEIAIIGVPNPERPGSEIVKAYFSIHPDYAYDGDEENLKKEITAFAQEKCSSYEVPKLFEIMDELPLTLVGKVDKKRLRKE